MAVLSTIHSNYTNILHSELKVAMGCTEPIAIAYCAAYAKKVLGCEPKRFIAYCSGNIIKNAKAVVVPQTGGLRGIEAAVIAGAVGGNPDAELEVLTGITDADRVRINELMERGIVEVKLLDSPQPLHVIITAFADGQEASVEIVGSHTHIGRIEKNGEVIKDNLADEKDPVCENYEGLNVSDILAYADSVDINDVKDILEKQIAFNSAISDEGLRTVYGAGIGPALMESAGDNLREQAKAAAAAASDARMNGCPLPVVINSGSGNQGITVSMPIIVYARAAGKTEEELLRALCVGNLIAIHQKTGIGKLSAFCGATSAAVGAMAGIAYMEKADYPTIAQLITNAIATVGGMVCDGAKSSCAGKIATALESAFIGYEAAKLNRGYREGEGIVKENVEKTIHSVARMAANGMRATDMEILNIMLGN